MSFFIIMKISTKINLLIFLLRLLVYKLFKNISFVFLVFITMCFSSIGISAQGFDWQYSARLPFETPNFYYGAKIGFNSANINGKITFIENNIRCPKFDRGSEIDYYFDINIERWLEKNQIAILASLGYVYNNSKYSFVDLVPISNKITAEYENKLNFLFSSINMSLGAKYRILQTHLHIGAAVEISANFAATYNVKEKILGPIEVPPFNTLPPSYEREVLAGKFYQIQPVVFSPKLELGYDLQLGLSKYITPVVSLSIPTMSIIKSDNVRKLAYSFGLRYLMSHKYLIY